MSKLDGHSTEVTKIGLEAYLSYNLGIIEDVGVFVVESAGSGTFTEDEDYSLPATGANLVVRANQPIQSAADIGITITGTDQDDLALTGNATIVKQAPRGQSYEVVPATAGKRFKTISSVIVSNGVFGDGFSINVLPTESDDVDVCFVEAFSPKIGTTVKQVFCNYILDHNKTLRPDNTLTINAFYVNGLYGLNRVADRDLTLRMDIRDDGGNAITEVWYYEKVRLGVARDKPAAGDDQIRSNAEGTFGREFIFS